MNRLFVYLVKNYKPLLTSLFLALLLWIAVITDKDYSRKITVPFSITRLAPGYVLLEKPTDQVVLEISGKGRALFGLNFYNSSIDLELPELNKSTTLKLNEYQKRFNIPRNLGINIVEILEPQTIPIKIDQFAEEEKDVKIEAIIKPLPGYVLSNIELNHQFVHVSGPRSLVRKLQTVHSESTFKQGVKYPFEQTIKLLNPYPGILSLEPKKITVKFEISQLVERTLYNIPIQIVGIPNNLDASAVPPNVTIRVKGSDKYVTALNANQVTAIFNYRTSFENGKTFYPVDIQIPTEVKLMEISPENFRLRLKRKEDME